MKKWLMIALGIILVFILASLFLKNLNLDEDYTAEVERVKIYENALKENATMTFEVEVPSNTQEGDTVWIYLHNQKGYKMDEVSENLYQKEIPIQELKELEEGASILYRYSRNGYDFATAEYLAPDTNDYFWTEKGRSVKFESGKIQRDKIERWRWFPLKEEIVKTSPITPEGTFEERVNGVDFRSMQAIEDLYVPAYDDFFNSTAAHMKETGYNWVEILPPEQLTLVDGMPKVVNKIEEAPNYPDAEKLKEEILAYKNQGIKVMLGPQLCCEEIKLSNQSEEWWNAYFSEVESFLVRMAIAAEETGVDAFYYSISNDYQGEDKDARWRKVFQEIKKHYSGEVGQMVWTFYNNGIIPGEEYITWADELDFFLLASDAPLSHAAQPTDEELKEGAGKIIDGSKILYDEFGKPIIVRSAYFNVRQTWKGSSFYNISSVQWMGSEEDELKNKPYEFYTEDLARTVNAYFRAISERPYVIGYSHFGYTHWEVPLCADLSIRGKPAEDVWRKWNSKIFS